MGPFMNLYSQTYSLFYFVLSLSVIYIFSMQNVL